LEEEYMFAVADAEGLSGHASAIQVRLDFIGKGA
jgi:hypothetical protein